MQSEQDRRIALAADHFKRVLITAASAAACEASRATQRGVYMGRDVIEEKAVSTGLVELQRALMREERFVMAAIDNLVGLVDLAHDIARDEGASESLRGDARAIVDHITYTTS